MGTSVPIFLYICIATATLHLQILVAHARRRAWIANGKTTSLGPYANVMTNIGMYAFLAVAGSDLILLTVPTYGIVNPWWIASFILFGLSAILFWSYRKDKLG